MKYNSMISKDDEFGMRCRAKTKQGKRCTRKVSWLTPLCVSRESWLEALRTGWPRMTRGMKSPEYKSVGTCTIHCDDQKYYYGIGKMGPAKKETDPEYEAAIKLGDEACRSWAAQFNR